MKGTIGRYAVFALCALVPAAYVLASEGLEPRYVIQREKEVPAAGGVGANYFPNVELTTHEGEKVRFYDDLIAGKSVVINFMYAQCEGICPGATNNLRKVQSMLGDLVGRELFFYSITLKPEEDSPEVLAEYAEMNRVGPGWTFLTGTPENIELLRQKLGFTDPDPEVDADKSSHIGVIAYGNEPLQQWAACPSLSDPSLIASQILWMVPEEAIPPHLEPYTFHSRHPPPRADMAQDEEASAPEQALVVGAVSP